MRSFSQKAASHTLMLKTTAVHVGANSLSSFPIWLIIIVSANIEYK